MSCPPELADVILAILRDGLLTIRVHGGSGNAKKCALHADHLHNLPSLLSHYEPELLLYYWNAERPSFAKQCTAEELDIWKPIWNGLRPFVVQANELMGRKEVLREL